MAAHGAGRLRLSGFLLALLAAAVGGIMGAGGRGRPAARRGADRAPQKSPDLPLTPFGPVYRFRARQ